MFFFGTGGRGLGSLDFETGKNKAKLKKYGPAGVLLFLSLKSYAVIDLPLLQNFYSAYIIRFGWLIHPI